MRSADRLTGTVKRVLKDKGYAFITGPHGDVFMHASGSEQGVFAQLVLGLQVTYLEIEGPRGLKAEAVEIPVGAVSKSIA